MNSIQALLLLTVIVKKALLLKLWSSCTTLQYVTWSTLVYWLSNVTAYVTDSVSPLTPESSVSVDLFPFRFLMSINPQIASIMLSRECPFFLFPLDWDGSASRFSACLRLWASLGVGSSSRSSRLLVLKLTCTPDDRKAASSSLSSSLLGAGWANEIWRKPVAVFELKSLPNRS